MFKNVPLIAIIVLMLVVGFYFGYPWFGLALLVAAALLLLASSLRVGPSRDVKLQIAILSVVDLDERLKTSEIYERVVDQAGIRVPIGLRKALTKLASEGEFTRIKADFEPNDREEWKRRGLMFFSE